MPIQTNIAVDLGETWVINHTSYSSDGVTPLNLTGGTVALYVKGTAGAILTPVQSTVTYPAPTAGQSNIVVTPAQQIAANVTAQVANYLIRTTLSDGTVSDQNIGVMAINSTAAS